MIKEHFRRLPLIESDVVAGMVTPAHAARKGSGFRHACLISGIIINN
jgi:hypothetical protein